MPKLARYTLAWSSVDTRYHLYDGAEISLMEDAGWEHWLGEHHSFSFIGRSGHLSLVKERRKTDYDYWYAYQRHGKSVVKRYAGRCADLTFARLEEVSQAMSGKVGQQFVTQLAELPDNTLQSGSPTTMPLLAAKIRLPQLLHSLVPRERLLAQLDARQKCKLILVSAPAGFGKTTLIRQWLELVSRENISTTVAWLSLDANDNDLLRFWRYLIAACRVFAPGVGDQSRAFLDALISSQSSMETLPMVFINELDSIQSESFLVLEDYHVITAPSIHETLGFLIDHLPRTVHLVIITRTTPPFSLARLRAANDLTEIEAPALRFSEAETSEFFQLNSHLPVSSDELNEIVSRVEGWAAGLRLLSLAIQGHQEDNSLRLVLENFAAGRRGIGDYFVAEVLNNQSELRQQFLLQTSFLNSLTASLCDSVTLRSDSQALLDAVQQANLFLEPLGGVERWYRYHALFATAMQAEAKHRLGEAAVRELAERAGRWYEAHGMLEEAINIAIAVGHIARATDLIHMVLEREYDIEQSGRQPPEFYMVENWLSRLPQTIIEEHPLFSLANANATLFASIVEMRTLTSVEENSIEKNLLHAEQGATVSNDTSVLSQVYGLRAMLSREQGNMLQAVRWAEATLRLLPVNEIRSRSLCISILGQVEEFSGNLINAADRLAEAQALCEKISNNPYARRLGIVLGRIFVEQNEFHRANVLFHRFLREAETAGDIEDISHALCGLSNVFLYWSDLDAAWARAREAVELAVQYPHLSSYVDAILLLARVEVARGESEAAGARCDALLASRPTNTSLQEKQWNAQIAFVQASIALSASDLVTVQRWRTKRHSDLEQSRVRHEEDEVLLARLLVAEGKAEDAIPPLEALLSDTERNGRERIALEARVALALAYAAENRQKIAGDTLAMALSDACPANAQRVFIDGGEPLEILLRTTLPTLTDKTLNAFARTILRAMPHRAAIPNELLSQQEQRVLRLIAQGSSNDDIAADLVVSVNTVKAHIKAIYRKLNVNNRVEAARIARDFDLL